MGERRTGGVQTPLLDATVSPPPNVGAPLSTRAALYDFLEPNRPATAALREAKESSRLKYRRSDPGEAGIIFENFMVVLIFVNVFSFVLSTVCVIRTLAARSSERPIFARFSRGFAPFCAVFAPSFGTRSSHDSFWVASRPCRLLRERNLGATNFAKDEIPNHPPN